MTDERLHNLEEQIKQLQVDKIELIRSTSTEIEHLRRIIRKLTNPDAKNIDNLIKLEYKPLTLQEKNKLSQPQNGMISDSQIMKTENSDNISKQQHNDTTLQQWDGKSINRSLGSLREEKTYEYGTQNNSKQSDENEQKTHRKGDTMFRLNTKRMSYKGFEFGDFGFMTTDFDQLSRGHTQLIVYNAGKLYTCFFLYICRWVNQVMHHPVQNGIVITASDDWCVMFWRFKKSVGSDILKQEKLSQHLKKQTELQPNKAYNDPKLQSIAGEIDLLPVLKINTGLEVKAIGMSTDGQILACTCYDEEEDEGNPELQLYFDANEHWAFKHHQFNIKQNTSNNKQGASGRVISRRIISLPFEPISHCLCFSRDNKYVFVAMYSSVQILEDLNEELEEEYGGRENMDEKAKNKYPDHPISLCCVNVQTQKIRECEKIWKYLKEDEHVSSMSIAPNGARIAIGTSSGQLIVTGVMNLTGDEDDDDFNPLLQKIWSSDMDTKDDDNKENMDGSCTAIGWSPDCEWIVCGYASGTIKLWQKQKKERKLSIQLNSHLKRWMGAAKVKRKNRMFTCVETMPSAHIESINSLSIRGSLMVSGADDGNVVIHDMMNTFVDGTNNMPITVGRVDKIHGGRMVNSVSLTQTYSEDNALTPSTGHFMVTSGADNVVHCVSVLDLCRETIRNCHSKKETKKQ